MRAPVPAGSLAVSTFRLTASPVTRPTMRPAIGPDVGRTKTFVTSRPSTSTRSRSADAPAGSAISTSASPPEIKSARFDNIRICMVSAADAVSGIAAGLQKLAARMPTITTRVIMARLLVDLAAHHGERATGAVVRLVQLGNRVRGIDADLER